MSDTTRQAVLWIVENSHGVVADLFDTAAKAQRLADQLNIERLRSDYVAVALYRDAPPPALTDAEREAVVWSIKECEREAVIEQSRATTGNYIDCALRECQAMSRASTLRAILARHSPPKEGK